MEIVFVQHFYVIYRARNEVPALSCLAVCYLLIKY